MIMNKDKISILDIKTPEQMFHFLNNCANLYWISKEQLEKVDKSILFSAIVWNKYSYFLTNIFEKEIEEVIKYIPKEWWIQKFYIDDVLRIKPELFEKYYDDIVNNEEVWNYLFKRDSEETIQYIKYIKDKDFYKLKNLFYKQIETIEKLKEAINSLYEIKEPKISDIDTLI